VPDDALFSAEFAEGDDTAGGSDNAARASMRQLRFLAAAGTVLLAGAVVTACAGAPPQSTVVMALTPAPMVAQPAPEVDPMLTQQACAAAALSAGNSTLVFHDEMAVIEKAAAEDDTGAMVAAADQIQRAFVQLAKGLETMSKRPLDGPVRAAFSAASKSLSEISSATYTGSTADINKRLSEVSASLALVCH